MESIIKRIRSAPFSLKLLTVYLFSLFIVIGLVTYEQVTASITMVEQSSYQNLDMLTEQISLNFANYQESCTANTYSRLRALDVPRLMNQFNSNDNVSTFSIRYALAQMITEGSDYDYVIIETLDKTTADAGYSAVRGNEKLMPTAETAKRLLAEHSEEEHVSVRWKYIDGRGLFYICDMYDISPLRHVGRAVFHFKDELFSVSESYKNTGFVFCDSDYNYICHAGSHGIPVLSEVLDASISGARSTDNYFLSKYETGGWVTVGYSSKEIYNESRSNIVRLGVQYGILGLILGIVMGLFPIISLHKKLNVLNVSMQKVAQGDFGYRAQIKGSDDISRIAYTFNYMTQRISELLDELLEKELAKKDAEFQILEYKYRSLETQIRPHFIYNALEVLNSMAKVKGDEQMAEIVQRISRYFRNITVNTTCQYITTKQEFDALEDYTEIYRLIYGDTLHVTFSAREAAKSAMLPTMIVQPIVENALKHGIRGQNEQSELIVHAYQENDKLVISVKDSGYGLSSEQLRRINAGQTSPSREHSGIGLENVRERLKLLYGDNASFSIDNRPEGGAVARIIIPFTYSEPASGDDEWDIDLE